MKRQPALVERRFQLVGDLLPIGVGRTERLDVSPHFFAHRATLSEERRRSAEGKSPIQCAW
jgi:hypothetical protein